MQIETTTRTFRTWASLDGALARIEQGSEPPPDWIALQGDANPCRLGRATWLRWLERLRKNTLRGFKTSATPPKSRAAFLAWWKTNASAGFHDFADGAWTKCYGHAEVVDFDYLDSYQTGGLEGLDPYGAYSAVLGTWEYSVEDFLATEIGSGIETIVEPLAGTAELCWLGHFRHPEVRYVMFDRDPGAKKRVEAYTWLPQTERTFLLGDALHEASWQNVRNASRGRSLGYIGKQSQNFFDSQDLVAILGWATRNMDHLLLEVSEPYLIAEEPAEDDLSRREMELLGLHVSLSDLGAPPPNPLTNRMSFDLVAKDRTGRRTLFEYHDWIGWQAPMLAAFGRLLDLDVRYFHGEQCEFVPIEQDFQTSDCSSNNSFLLFSRK